MLSEYRSRSRRGATLGILAAYVAIAIALTWPLVPQIATAVPNDLGDPVLNTWILWWNAVAVPFTDRWWNAPAYFPAEGVLTFSEHLLGLTPISTPLYWLTGNIQLGYNVVLFLSFPLSAFFGYLLCRELTGRRDAAFIGGLIFGFTPYRIVQLPHIQVVCSYWMPIALLGLHRFIREERPRWLVLFGVGWAMQALSNGYYMAFLSVLTGLWILWFVPFRRWQLWLKIGAAWALAAVPIVPIILKYRSVHHYLGLRRSIDEILLYSADITSLLDHSNRLVFWRFVPAFHRPEGELFPGIAGIILVAAGLWISRPGAATSPAEPPSPRLRRWRIGLTVVALLFLAGAISAGFAPWEFQAGPVTISATHMHKPLSLAFYCAIALLFMSPRVRRSTRGRTVLGFYVLGAAAMWMLSFGPKPTFMGIQALYRGPYAWLAELPGLDTLRTPARFHMLAILCLSTAAAICFGRIASRLSRPWPAVLTGVATVVIMADTWIVGFPLEPAPKPWTIEQQLGPGAVVVVPLGEGGNDVEVMYRAMWTNNAVVNGYSGYNPPWYPAIDAGLKTQDPAVLDELAARGVTQLVVDTGAEGSSGWQSYLATRPDVQLIGDDGAHKLYRLPPSVSATTKTFGPAVRITSASASVGTNLLANLTDGDLKTRWETGPQKGAEVLTIDLGGPTTVAAIETALGQYSMDAPRQLIVECSDDGQVWTKAWEGAGAALSLRAGFVSPLVVPVTIDIGDRTTRFLRLRQIGADKTYFWSIAELRVLSPAGR